MARIGVISDTHGFFRREIKDIFSDVDLIIHAGDYGSVDVIAELRKISMTVAVSGNVDNKQPHFDLFNRTEFIEFCGRDIYVIHNVYELDIDPIASGLDIVVFGHSHQPEISYRGSTLFFNPGSAGPKRLGLPISAGLIEITDDSISPKIIEIGR